MAPHGAIVASSLQATNLDWPSPKTASSPANRRGFIPAPTPCTLRTSLATWIHDQPLERSAVAKGVAILRPYVREALLFGALHGILSMQGRHVDGDPAAARKIARYLSQSSADVRDCAGQAGFVGRWLYRGGTVSTVLAMLGVQA